MTDRYNALIVVLDKDIREDDAQVIIEAIKQIKRVISVRGNVSDIPDHIAQERVRSELGKKIIKVIYGE